MEVAPRYTMLTLFTLLTLFILFELLTLLPQLTLLILIILFKLLCTALALAHMHKYFDILQQNSIVLAVLHMD